jgi:hypothetical protein
MVAGGGRCGGGGLERRSEEGESGGKNGGERGVGVGHIVKESGNGSENGGQAEFCWFSVTQVSGMRIFMARR